MTARFRAAALLLWLVSVPAAAGAQAEDPEAQRLFGEGVAAVEREDYATALVAFRRAYDLSGRAFLLYNIGMAHRALLQPVEAIAGFRRYLEESGGDLLPGREEEVRGLIAEMDAQLASIDVRVAPPGARVLLDGEEVAVAPLAGPLRVGPGTHVIEARCPGHADARREVAVMAGERTVVELRPAPLAVEPDPGIGDEFSVAEQWWFWTLLGAVVVGGAVTAGVLLWPEDEPAVWWTVQAP